LSDVRDLLREVFGVLEGMRDGLGDGGRDLDASVELVVADLEAESLEDLAFQLLGCVSEGCGQIGEPREQRGGVLEGPRNRRSPWMTS
jgi:hypothetical protein